MIFDKFDGGHYRLPKISLVTTIDIFPTYSTFYVELFLKIHRLSFLNKYLTIFKTYFIGKKSN